MNFFICYDISDDKRRLHLAKLLLRTGCKRVQKSVFLAIGFERKEMLSLKNKVHKVLNTVYTEGTSPNDSLLYIPLDNDAVKDVLWQGQPTTWANLWKKETGKLL